MVEGVPDGADRARDPRLEELGGEGHGGELGEFNRSLQHRTVGATVVVRRGRPAAEAVRATPDPLRSIAGSGRDTGVGRLVARSGELEFYAAYHGARMVGFAAIHQVPASLGLSRFWQLRDRFADSRDASPRHRPPAGRDHPTSRQRCRCAAAVAANRTGQCRGTRAYLQCGFTINADLTTLSLDIAR